MGAAPLPAASLDQRLASLRQTYGEAIPLDDLVDVVRGLLESLHGDVTLQDLRVYGELEALARYIRRAKEEIRSIRPDDISEEHIPTANVELDAIVTHLEEATGTILDSTEIVEAIATGVGGEVGERLQAAVTAIYEACNFQDISGQRITKVISTLQTIERRIGLLVEALGGTGEALPRKPGEKAATSTDDHLLNGPQLPDNANSQAEIDALLASFD
ncbi:MAG: chemotaxis protein CheZ [Geminicoccaceae bacterium]|nr:MAG: chemotaxis protein CheZ [Geminicoccaceae bacterium]